MALTESLIDSFNGSSLSGLWTSNAATADQIGGQLSLTSTAGTTNYAVITSASTYDLTGSYIQARLTDAGNQALTSWQACAVNVLLDANNSLSFIVNNNLLHAQKQVASSYSDVSGSLAYNASLHKYFRIRESGGTIYWDYSDGITWTNYTSLANPFAITSLYVYVQGGTYSSEGSATKALVDNFNVPINDSLIEKYFKAGNGMSTTGIAN